MIIRVKIDVTKIDKARLFKGKPNPRNDNKCAMYLDVTLVPRKDGADDYGNTHVAIQDVSKEERLAGTKGNILGSAKIAEQERRQSQPPPVKTKSAEQDTEDDVPF